MHNYHGATSRKILISSILGGLLVLLGILGGRSPAVHAQEQGTPPPRLVSAVTVEAQDPPASEYYSVNTLSLADGTTVLRHNIGGPSVPPAGYEAERQPVGLSAVNSTIIAGVPAYTSNFGCGGVSGGGSAAFDDRDEFTNLYRGPTDNGVLPLDDSGWGTWTDIAGATYRSNPIIASQNGLDGRTTFGSINDYWVSDESPVADPYTGSGGGRGVPVHGVETGNSQGAGWTQHTWGDAIGDYMYTSQSAYGNIDGATAFYTYQNSGRPYTCNTAEIENLPDGTRGMQHFYEARGYAVAACYNQPTDNIASGGFSFANFKAEIDAGRPVILGLQGHSVVGIGYDAATNLVYLHDGWDTGTHTMTWITDSDPNTHPSYAGRRLLMANIIHPIPPAHAGDVTISGYVGVPNATVNYTGGSIKASISGYYSFSVAPGWSGSVTPSKPGYAFDPPSRNYPNVSDYQIQQNYTAAPIPNSNLIQDPSFEGGTPNPIWIETSTNFGTPLCEKDSPFCQGVMPRTGMFWGWFGGTTASETATLSQHVTIPAGSAASLDFYLMIGEAGAGSSTDDVFTVKVDTTTVFSANATEINSYAAYMPVSVDLSAYANGMDHLITFKSVTSGQIVSFHLDDVSLAVTPSNPVPTISSINPTSATAGGASFALTVNGTNFISASKVRWNGADRSTTFVSSTQLTASIPASDITSAGTANVTVFNPTPGGGTSGQLSFTINGPSNDDFNTPVVFPGPPYQSTMDVSGATQHADDPTVPALCDGEMLAKGRASVWYKYIPSASANVSFDTLGSNYDTYVAVWTGTRNNLTLVGCDNNTATNSQSQLSLFLTAGTPYFIEVAEPTTGAAATIRNLTLHATTFADVPGNHVFWRYIEGFYTRRITNGCGANPFNYCPDAPVNRAAMAVFILRAKYGSSHVPDPVQTNIFSDLPIAGQEWMQPWIEEFYEEGVTTGCGVSPRIYCPQSSVTREAMAVFLLRAKYGAGYTPPSASNPPLFADVPVAGKEWMQPWIEEFYKQGYTTGCGTSPLIYCPSATVNRAAMAVFISRVFNIPQVP